MKLGKLYHFKSYRSSLNLLSYSPEFLPNLLFNTSRKCFEIFSANFFCTEWWGLVKWQESITICDNIFLGGILNFICGWPMTHPQYRFKSTKIIKQTFPFFHPDISKNTHLLSAISLIAKYLLFKHTSLLMPHLHI